MDGNAHQIANFFARCGTNRFDPAAALAKHDGPLCFALDQNLLVDFDAAVGPFRIFFGFDRARIGQFLMQLQVKLLAGDFGRGEAFGRIGNLIFGEMPFAFRHRCSNG